MVVGMMLTRKLVSYVMRTSPGYKRNASETISKGKVYRAKLFTPYLP